MVELVVPKFWENNARNEFHQRRRILRRAYLSLGITKVELNFGGGGDEGSLEDARHWNSKDELVDIPESYLLPDCVYEWVSNQMKMRFPDPVPRVKYNSVWQIESKLGFDLMEICGEDGWWNDSGGYATVDWNVTDDVFDLDVVEYVITERPARRSRMIDNRVELDQTRVAYLQLKEKIQEIVDDAVNKVGERFELTLKKEK